MIVLAKRHFGVLFPAHVIVDRQQAVESVGPSLARLMPEVVTGDRLFDHFSPPPGAREPDFADLARRGKPLQLHSRSGGLVLAGMVVETQGGFALALSHTPAALSIEEGSLRIDDFAGSDPTVPSMLQIAILKSLLEETQDMAADLARERKRSDELVGRIKDSASYLAHEFNNVNSIIELNCISALKAGRLSTDQEHRIRAILESANRAIEMSKALSTVAKQKNDSAMIEDVDEIIHENWPYFQMIAGARTELLGNLNASPYALRISRNGLVNCLTNLIMNSREAFGGNRGTIRIATWIDESAGLLLVEVGDNGMGMEEGVLKTAFEPFFTTKEEASGMGLASVMDFAREMGGKAILESIRDQGTTVTLSLPIDLSQTLPAKQPEAAPVTADAASRQPAAPARILLVDDEPFALEALEELLVDVGLAVRSAGSGSDALAALEAESFDVLLTDVVMPDLDGPALATRAMQVRPGIKVIMMSGYMPEFIAMQPEWLFIRKPLDLDLLMELIGEPTS